ncbi:TMEM165/GDT1 family protein [Sphingomonadaceae bacterium jetA1]|uniref:TMEM165/GDT1 family protein n=1 Tax=Facivitalis istanbulensis TaxID=3075838 RepID=UPI003489F177
MIALVVALLGQAGDRTGWLAARLADRDRRPGQLAAGLMLAMALVAALAVVAGRSLAASLTPEAKSLLLAVALVLLGIGAFRAVKPPAMRWSPARLGSLGGALLGGGVLIAGGGVGFVLAAAAARSPLPWAALPGALMGTLGAVVPPIVLGEREWLRLPLRAVRIGTGLVLVLAGLVIGLSSRGLI